MKKFSYLKKRKKEVREPYGSCLTSHQLRPSFENSGLIPALRVGAASYLLRADFFSLHLSGVQTACGLEFIGFISSNQHLVLDGTLLYSLQLSGAAWTRDTVGSSYFSEISHLDELSPTKLFIFIVDIFRFLHEKWDVSPKKWCLNVYFVVFSSNEAVKLWKLQNFPKIEHMGTSSFKNQVIRYSLSWQNACWQVVSKMRNVPCVFWHSCNCSDYELNRLF